MIKADYVRLRIFLSIVSNCIDTRLKSIKPINEAGNGRAKHFLPLL